MITNPKDYVQALAGVNNANRPQIATLLPKPPDEEIYEIDLNTRTVKAPKYLSVRADHYAEVIYFIVDRYYDTMDLASTICLIQYTNDGIKKQTGVEDEGHYYLVPYYDITTQKGKIIIPWMISGAATQAAGNVTFSFRFCMTNDPRQGPNGTTEADYVYSLNTQPAVSKVLYGIDISRDNAESVNVPSDTVSMLLAEIGKIQRGQNLYWIDA